MLKKYFKKIRRKKLQKFTKENWSKINKKVNKKIHDIKEKDPLKLRNK